jgi:hypothetical protein
VANIALGSGSNRAKVFCFFFSKKKFFSYPFFATPIAKPGKFWSRSGR